MELVATSQATRQVYVPTIVAMGDGLLTSKVALTIKTLGVEFQFLESR
jgi:hypothetical protein